MKTAILTTLIVACAMTSAPLSAEDKPAAKTPVLGMTMSMDKQMAQMQVNMKTMQQQMDKIRATTDPKQKQKLMQEHMQTMQDNMGMMRGMGGPTLQGGGQHGGMGGMSGMDGMNGMGGKKDGAPGDMAHRHDMLVQRVDMLQMMMEQMMQHDQMMPSMPAK